MLGLFHTGKLIKDQAIIKEDNNSVRRCRLVGRYLQDCCKETWVPDCLIFASVITICTFFRISPQTATTNLGPRVRKLFPNCLQLRAKTLSLLEVYQYVHCFGLEPSSLLIAGHGGGEA
ncbi:PREDICTED: uncharacterized protein LOC104802382 [Tarenaya hassleriana]|uniref:uncharacterized protein LOC104802382 n=1 Tax=Tarenaya hassleriana TaxID=28532 RepID=UPI00053C2C77|nr:PREDICTED: uncharacterized protein LOC104802382 [Tarenaya hassleriana]